jgi:hypothetical protein
LAVNPVRKPAMTTFLIRTMDIAVVAIIFTVLT